ncbi:uncharacterized protein LOC111410948 [Olea europaea var. sylvestris]|uniref:Uncharacterized protein n=1 Tax=Olea europaea subsp. europaea TaxID=158383 RepID=A0A8S0PL11_OLEEU|nr:uncharacterized protein LOC111410948 [Olea europaea var. sylvestris]CAA2951659.1 Hypothetical predicted protein [Olea europaea subsp. europaea]
MKIDEIEKSDKRKGGGEEKERTLKVWDCGSPLYDSYELVSVSHVIERHFMVFPYLTKSRNVKKSSPVSSSPVLLESNKSAGSTQVTQIYHKVRGFALVNFLFDLVDGNLWKKQQHDGETKKKSKPKKLKNGVSQSISQSPSRRKSNNINLCKRCFRCKPS